MPHSDAAAGILDGLYKRYADVALGGIIESGSGSEGYGERMLIGPKLDPAAVPLAVIPDAGLALLHHPVRRSQADPGRPDILIQRVVIAETAADGFHAGDHEIIRLDGEGIAVALHPQQTVERFQHTAYQGRLAGVVIPAGGDGGVIRVIDDGHLSRTQTAADDLPQRLPHRRRIRRGPIQRKGRVDGHRRGGRFRPGGCVYGVGDRLREGTVVDLRLGAVGAGNTLHIVKNVPDPQLAALGVVDG